MKGIPEESQRELDRAGRDPIDLRVISEVFSRGAAASERTLAELKARMLASASVDPEENS